MSVSSCAYLYQPDEPFNANAFESWFHRSTRYQPDNEAPPEESLADDYMPVYSWFESATEQLCARAKAVAPFRLVPITLADLEYDEEADVWDSESMSPRLCLIQAVRCLEMAKRNHKNMTYKELVPYYRAVQNDMRELEREIQHSLGSRIMRLVRRDE